MSRKKESHLTLIHTIDHTSVRHGLPSSPARLQTDFDGAFNGAVAKLPAAGAPITAVISYYGVDQWAYNGFFALAGSPVQGPLVT